MVHFFDLSAELRVRIYYLVFRDLKLKPSSLLHHKRPNTSYPCGLVHVCKQLSEECRPIFLSHARFDISPYISTMQVFKYMSLDPLHITHLALGLGYVSAYIGNRTPEVSANLESLINLRTLTFYSRLLRLVLGPACFEDFGDDREKHEEFVGGSTVNATGTTFIKGNAASLVGRPHLEEQAAVAYLVRHWRSRRRQFKLIAQVDVNVADDDRPPTIFYHSTTHSVSGFTVTEVSD